MAHVIDHPESWQEDEEDQEFAKALQASREQQRKDEDERNRQEMGSTTAIRIMKMVNLRSPARNPDARGCGKLERWEVPSCRPKSMTLSSGRIHTRGHQVGAIRRPSFPRASIWYGNNPCGRSTSCTSCFTWCLASTTTKPKHPETYHAT